MPRLTRHLSFANVCSLLALVVALGTGTAYAANTVRSVDIINGQVRTADLATNAVTSAKIKNGQVGVPDLATGSVGTRAVADDTLGAADLGAGSVGGSEIQTDGVGAGEIAPNVIDGDEVVNNSLTANDLASGSVTGSELAANSVEGADVVNNSLTFSDIVGGAATGNVSIGAGQVADGRCEGLNISISGAQAGDAVVFSVQGAMQDGVFFYGVQVTAANNLRAVLCNMSGAAQAAIVNLPVRVLTFR